MSALTRFHPSHRLCHAPLTCALAALAPGCSSGPRWVAPRENAAPISAPAAPPSGSPPSSNEVTRRHAALETLARAASDTDHVQFEVVSERSVELGGHPRLAVGLRVEQTTFAFGVFAADTGRSELVGEPWHDCQAMSLVSDADLNADGAADFHFHLVVPSNRYPIRVEEDIIYLSDPERRTYCYAERLGALLAETNEPLSASALESLRLRAGPAAFHCPTEGH